MGHRELNRAIEMLGFAKDNLIGKNQITISYEPTEDKIYILSGEGWTGDIIATEQV